MQIIYIFSADDTRSLEDLKLNEREEEGKVLLKDAICKLKIFSLENDILH